MILTPEEYTALSGLARKGASTPDELRVLNNYLSSIETRNGVKRYFLKVRYQESGTPLQPTVRFPTTWPPELEFDIELYERPISKTDVNNMLTNRAKQPTNVMVTKDPGGIVGWSKLDDFFAVTP